MTQVMPFVITISRQLGSGGAYLGQQLSHKLNAMYLDREILRHAAEKLKVSEEDLERRDETTTPLWQSILLSSSYGAPTLYTYPPLSLLSDQEVYQAESEIITRIAQKYTAVIVGRGGSFVLRNHTRHASIFLYADISFRSQRVQEVYHIPAEKARKLIESSDRTRARYLHALTGLDWVDARQYHLCLDTGALGFKGAEEIILPYLRARFGHIGIIDQPMIESV